MPQKVQLLRAAAVMPARLRVAPQNARAAGKSFHGKGHSVRALGQALLGRSGAARCAGRWWGFGASLSRT